MQSRHPSFVTTPAVLVNTVITFLIYVEIKYASFYWNNFIWLPFVKHCQTSIAEPVYMKKKCYVADYERMSVDFKKILTPFTRARINVLPVAMVFIWEVMELTVIVTSLLT